MTQPRSPGLGGRSCLELCLEPAQLLAQSQTRERELDANTSRFECRYQEHAIALTRQHHELIPISHELDELA